MECKYYIHVISKNQHCESHLPIEKSLYFLGTYCPVYLYFFYLYMLYLLCKRCCRDEQTFSSDHLLYVIIFWGGWDKIKFIKNEMFVIWLSVN